jgi:hypothetical protein
MVRNEALAIGFALEDTGMLQAQEEPSLPCNAYQKQEFQQLKSGMAELVSTLPEPWGLVIYRHYLQQQPFTAIAEHLQLSKARGFSAAPRRPQTATPGISTPARHQRGGVMSSACALVATDATSPATMHGFDRT